MSKFDTVPDTAPARAGYRMKFDLRRTKAESLHAALDELLGKLGCTGCGRISIIDAHINEILPEREIAGLESIAELRFR